MTAAPVDLLDETFVVAAPAAVAAAVHDTGRWRHWWPDLALSVFQDRGEQGIRWNVTGALAGSMEVWLEPYGDGVIVHYYLRGTLPPDGPVARRATPRAAARAAAREVRRRAVRAKQVFWRLKDELEAGRPAGEPASRPGTDAPGTGRARGQERR